ncbi:MAG: hypothetical protein CM15mP23_06780 [Cryomorphaceae bacterium]|nr:MAG: hypothetical protein CM15mP23_06780 [Cryomorphaceae bacterium]
MRLHTVSFLEIFDDQNGISNIDELEYFVNLDTLIIEHLDIIPDITALTNLDRLLLSGLLISSSLNLFWINKFNLFRINECRFYNSIGFSRIN